MTSPVGKRINRGGIPWRVAASEDQDVLKVAISSLLLGGGSINVLLIRLSRRRLARLDFAPLKTS